jgi:hypothetical protein
VSAQKATANVATHQIGIRKRGRRPFTKRNAHMLAAINTIEDAKTISIT